MRLWHERFSNSSSPASDNWNASLRGNGERSTRLSLASLPPPLSPLYHHRLIMSEMTTATRSVQSGDDQRQTRPAYPELKEEAEHAIYPEHQTSLFNAVDNYRKGLIQIKKTTKPSIFAPP